MNKQIVRVTKNLGFPCEIKSKTQMNCASAEMRNNQKRVDQFQWFMLHRKSGQCEDWKSYELCSMGTCVSASRSIQNLGYFTFYQEQSVKTFFVSFFFYPSELQVNLKKKKKKINGIRVIPWVTVMQFVHTNKVIGFWLGIHFSLVQVLVKHLVYIILHCLNSNCTMCGGQNEELFALAVMG